MSTPPLVAYRQQMSPGQTFTFDFWDESTSPGNWINISQFLVGISGFCLSYGSDDHEVTSMSVALTVVAQTTTSITVQASLDMTDGSHNLSVSDSFVDVTVLALTANDPLVVMQNIATLPATVAIPQISQQSLPILAGFALAYGSYHYVNIININVGCNLANSSDIVTVTGTASMSDSSGNTAETATVNAGVFINCDPTIELSTSTLSLTDCASTTIGFTPIAVFLTGLAVEYSNGGHWVNTFAASVYSNANEPCVYSENLESYIRIWDNSGNVQGSNSSVSFTAIGLDANTVVYDTVSPEVQ
jgi:hypothetical protein